MNLDAYRVALSGSGKLKMRATALLAEGGEERAIEAAVLFHDAARAERRSLAALEAPAQDVRLAVAIEECWCLLEGGDPRSAARVWGDVLRESEGAPDLADVMRTRLNPKYAEVIRGYARALMKCPTLQSLRPSGSLMPSSREERAALEKEIAVLLRHFPGIAGFWWLRYRLADAAGKLDQAWSALRIACRLEPENPRFASISLLLATRSLRREQADDHLASVYASIESAAPEICLLYAFAEIDLAREGKDVDRRWERALRAIQEGLSRRDASEGLRLNLRAAQLLMQALLADRKPTVEILYLAGLGDVVASTLTNPKQDVIELLEIRARTEVERAERVAA